MLLRGVGHSLWYARTSPSLAVARCLSAGAAGADFVAFPDVGWAVLARPWLLVWA